MSDLQFGAEIICWLIDRFNKSAAQHDIKLPSENKRAFCAMEFHKTHTNPDKIWRIKPRNSANKWMKFSAQIGECRAEYCIRLTNFVNFVIYGRITAWGKILEIAESPIILINLTRLPHTNLSQNGHFRPTLDWRVYTNNRNRLSAQILRMSRTNFSISSSLDVPV